jgi:tetratricopeptide (TPR) repeat protein/tRNA A-37 threonylcarbamoyl transferase component Bud32
VSRGPTHPDDPSETLTASETAPGPITTTTDRVVPGSEIGRYVVLSRLGAGGMGVVWVVYDPELDRKVALKLLRAAVGDSPTARARLSREARALAQLAHPNVVAVHDVGEHEGAVYVAMEFVEGRTLKQWFGEPRTWSEVLGVMLDAARGLEAAHLAGLVHRDIKPDNIIVGNDGRVRVMDFGLARSPGERAGSVGAWLSADEEALEAELTAVGSAVGTPAYMAPEQHLGLASDARADQFGFCVTLWEGLFGQRPFPGSTRAAIAFNVTQGNRQASPRDRSAPRWLRAIVERGLAADPEQRFPSMTAWLEAVSRARRRTRLARLGVGAGVLAGVVGTMAVARVADHRERVAGCEAAAAAIGQVWNAAAAGALDQALGEGASAEVTRARPWLDRFASAWSTARLEVCTASEVETTLESGAAAGAVACLDERSAQLEHLLAAFAEPDATAVRRLVPAAASLPDPAGCTDALQMSLWARREPEVDDEAGKRVRRQLARVWALSSAGRYRDALEDARAVAEESGRLSSPILQSEARLSVGSLLGRTGDYEMSATELSSAFFGAGAAGEDELAARAATELVFVAGYHLQLRDEALTWARLAKMLLARVEQTEGVTAATLSHNVGVMRWVRGEYDQALESHGRALKIRTEVHGEDHPEVASSLNNLANIHLRQSHLDLAEVGYRRALAIWERTLGPTHAYVARVQSNLGEIHAARGEHDQALSAFEASIATKKALFGPNNAGVALSLGSIAAVHEARGHHDKALAAREQATAIWKVAVAGDHPDLADALVAQAQSLLALGRRREARVLVGRALEILGERDDLGSRREAAAQLQARIDSSPERG